MRICLAIIAFLAVLAAPNLASAASFDCARAASDLEETICGDPRLSRSDEVLAVAYATAIGGLSKAAVNQMRQGQNDWLEFANHVCIAAKIDETLEERASCLLDQFQDRIAKLSGSRMAGGNRFYVVSGYAALPDPDYDVDSPWHTATHEVVSPRIDADDAMAENFNALMAEIEAEYAWSGDEDPDSSSDTALTAAIDEVVHNRITVAVTSSWYGHGAAHSNYGLSYIHYLIEHGRKMEAGDLFGAEGWQEKLADLTFAALEAEHGDNLFDDYRDNIGDLVTDPDRWIFKDYGLGIQFQPYEVSAYAYGAPTVTVRWQDLEPLLSESGENLRWGY